MLEKNTRKKDFFLYNFIILHRIFTLKLKFSILCNTIFLKSRFIIININLNLNVNYALGSALILQFLRNLLIVQLHFRWKE